ncbi:MAG: extracellular solute-binding protein [Clostridia bacterium]
MFKKLVSFGLVLVMLLACTAAQAQAFTEASGTVRILSNVTGGKDSEEMELWAAALSEATGLTITVERPASDYDTILMQKLGAGEAYDLVYITAGQYLSLVQQGALTDITDYVSKSSILSNNVPANEWADITVDGKVYAGFNKRELHIVVALNKVMLEKAGIDYKTIEPTMDGYYKAFKALKEANADKPDFYPLNTIVSQNWDLQPWMSSVGLKGGVVTDTDGKRYVPYATEAAAPVWEWFKKLYDEGLLDPASFVDVTKDMRNKMGAASQQTAVCVDWAAWVGLHNANAAAGGVSTQDFEIVSLPGLKTPDGKYSLRKGSASLFAIPVNAANVPGAVKVLEYFATQEGGELLSLGVKDHDYTVDGSTYQLTEIGAAHSMDHGAPMPIFKDFKNPIGMNLGVDEAISYLDSASIETIIPNENDYKGIVGKWAISMIKGEVSIADGLTGMRQELVTMEVCDK